MKQKINSNMNEYRYIHSWIRNTYGSADHCTNPDCEGKSTKYEWALIHGYEYDYNINNFKQLCTTCHRKYDQIGTKRSAETKKKMSEWQKGKPKPSSNYKRSPETKKKMSEWQKGKVWDLITCPHCGTEGGKCIMKRWHFDNCKYKKEI